MTRLLGGALWYLARRLAPLLGIPPTIDDEALDEAIREGAEALGLRDG